MAIQKNDSRTLSLDGVPKKRGRPVTGNALSNSARQARHRAWKKLQQSEAIKSAMSWCAHMSDDEVKSWLAPDKQGASEFHAWLELGRRRGWLK